jgi:hypothetical protein
METILANTPDEANELRGRPRLSDADLDDIEGQSEAKGTKAFAVDFTKLEVGESPFQVDSFKPRPREGWHQTIKRDDEIQDGQLLGVGYKFIRKQLTGKDENGKAIPRQALGQEKGERYKQFDHHDAAGRACYVYWMEVPQELVDADIRASVFKSHSRLKDAKKTRKNWVEGLNSSIGRKDEVVTISEDFEDGREVIHPPSKD